MGYSDLLLEEERFDRAHVPPPAPLPMTALLYEKTFNFEVSGIEVYYTA